MSLLGSQSSLNEVDQKRLRVVGKNAQRDEIYQVEFSAPLEDPFSAPIPVCVRP